MMLTLSALFSLQSCKEDIAAYSEFSSFTDPVIVAPANGGFVNVAGTTVELKWLAESADGDAQNWDVYFGTSGNPPLVKTGNTSQSYTVTVAKGVEYFWNVVGNDANGVPARSATWSFKVTDPDADMTVSMSWSTDVKTAIGLKLTPEKVADMRLLIVNDADKSIVAIVDGSDSTETTSALSSLPAGKYIIATDIFKTINAGDLNKKITLGIILSFTQPGTLDQTISFPQIMTNEKLWSEFRVYLAVVNKVGSVYTIEKSLSSIVPVAVTWQGTDADYPSQVVTLTGNLMSNLGAGWMLDWWGEIIISGGTMVYQVDVTGNITIPNQYYCTTTYNGAVQTDYYIEGTGTLNVSGAFPVMTIQYDFIQGGSSIATTSMDYGWLTPYFEAIITTDPAGKKSSLPFMTIPKPKR